MSTAEAGLHVQRLYSDHHAWLRGWLLRRLRCSHAAADLAHDTFVRVLDQYRRGELTVRQPRAYLRIIADGLLIDHLRRRALEKAYLETLAALPEPLAISPEEREIILEALYRIDALLDRMPARMRSVFLLAQLEGLTYGEIAGQLGISMRTVKRDMQRAFARCLALML